MNMKKDPNRPLLCKSDIKEKYGITDGLIKKYFDAPDLSYKYLSSTVQRWYEDKVQEIISKEDFQRDFQKILLQREKRKQQGFELVRRNLAVTERFLAEAISNFTVVAMPFEQVSCLALRYKENYMLDKGVYDFDVRSADENTVKRWTVNYIRHNLTNYDEVIDWLKGKTGGDDAISRFQKTVFDKIAETYPMCADECKLQWEIKFGGAGREC